MSTDGRQGATVEQLHRELFDGATAIDSEAVDPAERSEQIVTGVLDGLFPEEDFEFDEDLTKNSLDELLVLLVALRNSDTHGKGLMEDLSKLFDADLSPGTVYPRLHDLESEEILEMHELVRTKEYRIDDSAAARDRVEDAMRQHLALGFVFHTALEEL